MINLRKMLASFILLTFSFVPMALGEQLDNNYVEKISYDEANEEFISQKSTDPNAATPFAAKTDTYWTSDMMENAMPYPMPVMEGTPEAVDISNLDSQVGNNGGVEKGSLSLSDIANKGEKGLPTALSEEKEAVAIAGGDISTLAYPPPHNTFYVPTSKYRTFPYKTIGKVFFTSGGYNYTCSGSSVGGRAVLTAGHCVSNGSGSWHSNWVFAPAYMNGSYLYGAWSAFYFTTFSSWFYNGNLCRDVGFAAVSDKNGYTLSQTVGHLGFAWNQSVNLTWDVLGYYGGWMVQTHAAYSRSDSPNGCTSHPLGIGTSQTGPEGGSTRIWQFVEGSVGANNYANGVNSYAYSMYPLEIFSPYFDSSVSTLKNAAVSQ